MNFVEHLPTIMCVSSSYISWMMPKKGAEDGSRTPRHGRWLWKNQPLGPLEEALRALIEIGEKGSLRRELSAGYS